MNLPTFREINLANFIFLHSERKPAAFYPGFCAGAKETARRARQIEAGKLSPVHEPIETVKFEVNEG